jgi:hypothetical protein
MRTRTLSVAALLVATGLAFVATTARAGTPNATAPAETPNATAPAETPNATAPPGTPDAPKEGVNEHGETYGIMRTRDPQPDLIAVVGGDSNGHAVEGYARKGDLWHNDPPASPAEALRTQTDDHGRDIPVFKTDGATRLGTFHVTGAGEGPTAPPVPLR